MFLFLLVNVFVGAAGVEPERLLITNLSWHLLTPELLPPFFPGLTSQPAPGAY